MARKADGCGYRDLAQSGEQMALFSSGRMWHEQVCASDIDAVLFGLITAGWFALGDSGKVAEKPNKAIRVVEGKAATPIPASERTTAPATVLGDALPDGKEAVAQSPQVGDDIAKQMLPPEAADPRVLYARLRAEPRDPEWAPRAEQAIKLSYAAIPYVGTAADPLRVRCGVTMCEVAGATASDVSSENTNVDWQTLQGKALSDTLANSGLGMNAAVFGSAGETFVTYLTRR